MGDAPARVHAKQPGHLAAPGAALKPAAAV